MALSALKQRLSRLSRAGVRWRSIMTIVLLAIGAYVSVSGMYAYVRTHRVPTLGEAFPMGEMRVAVDTSYPPFAVDVGGRLDGLDIELGQALADEIGIPVRFIPIAFDGLYDSVINGGTDVVISALLVNPAKMGDVRYTRPYYDNGLLLVSPSTQAVATMRDVVGRTLALEYGSIAHGTANYHRRRLEAFSIHPYELPRHALDAVRYQQSDGALVTATSYHLYKGTYPDWDAHTQYVTHAPYAIAVRVDRLATWRTVDSALARLIDAGDVQTLIDKWLS